LFATFVRNSLTLRPPCCHVDHVEGAKVSARRTVTTVSHHIYLHKACSLLVPRSVGTEAPESATDYQV
jgi:hypothetical protein